MGDLGTCVPALHDLGVRDLQSPSPHPWSLPDTTRAARVGAAATAAAAGGAMVAGEPLRRVGAPTPRLAPLATSRLSQRSKVIAITSSGKSFSPISPSLHAWGRARRHSHIASQPAALRRAQPLPPYTAYSALSAAPQRRNTENSYAESEYREISGFFSPRSAGATDAGRVRLAASDREHARRARGARPPPG